MDSTQESEHNVFQKRFDARGQALTSDPIQVSTFEGFPRSTPKVTALLDGGWLVTWTSDLNPDVGGAVVYQQRYDRDGHAQFTKDGKAEERLVSVDNGQNSNASASALPDGGWIVIWQSNRYNDNGTDIYLQRYDSNGNPLFPNEGTLVGRQVNPDASNGELPSVTTLTDGGWVVTWRTYDPSTGDDIFQRHFDPDGEPGSTSRVNATLNGDQSDSRVVALSKGGWLVTWLDQDPENTDNWDLYQQAYDAQGRPRFQTDAKAEAPTISSDSPYSVAGLNDGGWVFTWTGPGSPAVLRSTSSATAPAGAPSGQQPLSTQLHSVSRKTHS
ncbi:hypothetical protein AAII07_24485 [Microvirga sp. 0TCS3.31]